MAKISPAMEENRIDVTIISDITFGERSTEKSDRLPTTKYIDMNIGNTTHAKAVSLRFEMNDIADRPKRWKITIFALHEVNIIKFRRTFNYQF
uniref:Uncharacterized protein n=1 Tax=Elaeophora elaphi TaxID=1147741 RepID=A0A0R3RG73_9BILA